MNDSRSPLLPGATIGVLGSGQLGRMLTQAAVRMGYRVRTYAPDAVGSPAALAGAEPVAGEYGDSDAVAAFARSVAVVTFEFENVAAEATGAAESFAPVRPHGSVLHTTQHRLREKTFLRQHGFPVTPFREVRNGADVDGFSYPAILKTAGFGYDGKGQRRVNDASEARAAFEGMNGVPCVLEALVDFSVEVSVVAARGSDGAFVAYPVVRNDHSHHILDVTVAPVAESEVPAALQREAETIARGVLEALDVVGVLCVEYFVTTGGELLINELAPRPHNSGHWTIEACACSQFEQQLRAVCGLPLGAVRPRRAAAMANLLGDLWEDGEPNWSAVLEMPEVHLHLYGKATARPGRKMGHLTALAETTEAAAAMVRTARLRLRPTL
ncbi:MAG: 5-(carboxyamino)imidazole ribonucleotide synthase [Capsulimonadales bacterium]|nr:5-(carboxyamino)imidazole ribonucleotide synthase [Capsulimonadales bacterium]